MEIKNWRRRRESRRWFDRRHVKLRWGNEEVRDEEEEEEEGKEEEEERKREREREREKEIYRESRV